MNVPVCFSYGCKSVWVCLCELFCSVCVWMCVFAGVWLCVHLFLSVVMGGCCVSVSVPLCVCVIMLSLCVSEFVNLSMYLCIYVCIPCRISVCVFTWGCLIMWDCLAVCLSVSVCFLIVVAIAIYNFYFWLVDVGSAYGENIWKPCKWMYFVQFFPLALSSQHCLKSGCIKGSIGSVVAEIHFSLWSSLRSWHLQLRSEFSKLLSSRYG